MSELTKIETRPMLDAGDDWNIAKRWLDLWAESAQIAPNALKQFTGVNAVFAFAGDRDLAAGSLRLSHSVEGFDIYDLITDPDLSADDAKGAMRKVIQGLYNLAEDWRLPINGIHASNSVDAIYLAEVRAKALTDAAKAFAKPSEDV